LTGSENKIIHQLELPVKLEPATIIAYLGLDKTSEKVAAMVGELADMALAAARPRAIYQVSPVCGIDGAAGRELDELPVAARDLMRQYCLDVIKTMVLVSGIDYLSDYLKSKYSLEHVALMNPGEIKSWPLTEQKPLFALFGGAERQIGVTLSPSGVMKPVKSRSGILFPNDTGFLSCRLCTQFQCPGRKAAYDPELEKEYMA